MRPTLLALLLSSLLSTAALAQTPPPPPPPGGPAGGPPPGAPGPQRYSLEQALSDQAQLHTIAFSGLAFLTGDFASDTFLPPGKVSDYFGFQYMRDIDTASGGHQGAFLTRIAHAMLALLTPEQRTLLIELARLQQPEVRRFAERRLPLIQAFRQQLDGRPLSGPGALSQAAVMKYSAELYELDGKLAYQRAKVMAHIVRSLDAQQRQALARMKFGDSRTWPNAPEVLDKRQFSHDVHVLVMTYASEMFSWAAGSLEADVYFCPERHGMYFGGFGMKTAPAIGRPDYAISTALTGDSGQALLALLTPEQRSALTELPAAQRADLAEIVRLRRQIASELRKLLNGEPADQAKVLAASRRYGELDGRLSWRYGMAFARIQASLSPPQRAQLARLRPPSGPGEPKGPFIYSEPVRNLSVGDSGFLFSR